MRNLTLCVATILLFLTACGRDEKLPSRGEDAQMDELNWMFAVDAIQNRRELIVKMTVSNMQDKIVDIQFHSGQLYEIILVGEENEEVYRYSDGRMFMMAITEQSFASHESKTYKEVIPIKGIKTGTYTLEAELVAMAVDNKEWSDENTFQSRKKIEITK